MKAVVDGMLRKFEFPYKFNWKVIDAPGARGNWLSTDP